MKHKNVTLGIAAVISALITATTLQAATISTNAQLVGGMASTNVTAAAPMDTTFTVQKTATSVMDELPGHEMHQAVVALPARDDGKIWVGTVTWTSSKPIEVRILHDYNSSITVDEVHGKPLIAPFGNGTTAISLILQDWSTSRINSRFLCWFYELCR